MPFPEDQSVGGPQGHLHYGDLLEGLMGLSIKLCPWARFVITSSKGTQLDQIGKRARKIQEVFVCLTCVLICELFLSMRIHTEINFLLKIEISHSIYDFSAQVFNWA